MSDKKIVNRKTLQEQGLECMDIEHIKRILEEGNFLYVVSFSTIDMKIADLEKKIQSYYDSRYKPISPLLSDLSEQMMERSKKLVEDNTLKNYQIDLLKLKGLKGLTTQTLSYNLDINPKATPEKVSISSNYRQFTKMLENFDIKRVSVNRLKYFAYLYNNLIERYSLKHLNRFMAFVCSYEDINVSIFLSESDFIKTKLNERLIEARKEEKRQKQIQLDLRIKLASSVSLQTEYGYGNGKSIHRVVFVTNERAKKLLSLKYGK